MSTSQILVAFTLTVFLICAITGLSVRFHQTWENSRLHSLLLWIRIERRARTARTPVRGPIQTTSMNGRLIRADQPAIPALILLAYRLEDPYAIRLLASAADDATEHVFARDLLIEAVTTGRAGEGQIRIARSTSSGLLGVSIDTSGTSRTYYLPLKKVRAAVAAAVAAIPLGSEQQPGLDRTLALLLDPSESH